ncbi:MAG: LamG domain-containing protein [Phycisphaeraceae bacterium]
MTRQSFVCSVILLAFVTGALALAADIAPINITKAPDKDEHTVLLLHLDEGEGDVAADQSGLNNHGKISGATWCEGKFGKALEFDGVDDYLSCLGERHRPPHFDFGETTDFTIEFWINSTSTRRGAPLINKKLRGSFDDPGFYVYLDNGKAKAAVADGINQVVVSHPQGVTDGQWHHIALVVERKANATLYVDGVAGDSVNVSYLTDVTNPKRELRIMDRGHDAGTKGMVDEIRISKVARRFGAPTKD